MNPMNYLYFTLLSIFIQFCLMDIIMDDIKNVSIATNITSVESKTSLKKIIEKPHALFYRTELLGADKGDVQNLKYSNSTLAQSNPFSTTEYMSTSFDLLYDENASLVTDDFTTEPYLTTTELDNNTEIAFIDKVTTTKPLIKPKKNKSDSKICHCNLLYQVCDINCCCDVDCTIVEHLTFRNYSREVCKDNDVENWQTISNTCDREINFNAFEKLFCISKINLPERKNVARDIEVDESVIASHFKWHAADYNDTNTYDDNKYQHRYGELMWVSKNGTFNIIDLPVPVINNYCYDTKSVKFLNDVDITCYTKLKDLHMLQVIQKFQDSNEMSMISLVNSTVMNCSSLQCINWTLLICKTKTCEIYTQEQQPSCSATYCNNIALRIEYIFYCNTTGLTNATIKFFLETISISQDFIKQEISVRFYVTNSTDKLVHLSGNPGYNVGLPVIISNAGSNHTYNFFDASKNDSNYVNLPQNKDGVCVMNDNSKMLFGHNKRFNCRFRLSDIKFSNGTEGCLQIQNQINDFLDMGHDIYISPYGNPERTGSDQNWLLLEQYKQFVYGEYRPKRLLCFDIVTRYSFIILYQNMADGLQDNNKIISGKVEFQSRNLTFNMEESMATIITIDISFIDAGKSVEHLYAGAPRLNINLPKNFFLPFY